MRKQYNIVAALSLFCSINASAQFSASYPNHDGSYVSSTFFNQYPDLFNTLIKNLKLLNYLNSQNLTFLMPQEK
ncbi:MAG: hypothetical protein V8R52_09425 [Coprobacter fastidiosus]